MTSAISSIEKKMANDIISSQGVALLALALMITGLGVKRFFIWYRLRHIPGPQSASISVLWQLRNALSGRGHESLRELSESYGV
jgi:hypothetical protein